MADVNDLPGEDHGDAQPPRPEPMPPSLDERRELLKAAIASGPVTTIPLSGGEPDPVNDAAPLDVDQLAELFGRHLTAQDVDLARAILAGPTAWAADPSRHREFLATELHAWTTAQAGGDDTANLYGSDHPDRDLRTVWTAAFARAQAAQARARRAEGLASVARTVRFWSVNTGSTIGTVTLTATGELEYSGDSVREILRGWVSRAGAEKAFLYYTNWSNGYIASSEI